MTTLVTGGRGFVGRHVVDQLLAEGERVVMYNRDYSVDARDGVVAVLGELFDIPRLTDTLRTYEVDRIIHTAGQSHPALSIELPVTTFAANADGTLAVYEAARMTGVQRIVFFSSECALGNITGDGPVTEDIKPAPTTVYGVTKVAGELLGSAYNSLYDMEIVSLRITEVYGPGLWMPSLLGDMIRAGLRGETFTLESGGDHGFQFVYVDDVASAARLASTTGKLTQQAYFVSGGDRMTVFETADLLKKFLPDARFDIGPGYLPDWDRQVQFDLSRSERDLGYVPGWALEKGLEKQIDWLRGQAHG
ncbi:polysaccharide biosynthesis family protein [Mycobacterium vulneris]|uniref:NAD(P)-dependent oxidoreductase n=1 Tax=Mycolicibacterium porcinum TaxID=39693 RepID=A0AAW5T0K2_9MYCO|nr:NAD(P)-dependent oxidoreductase [Mycolicibacterium porcinum]OCB41946.1 polysaccharide biosynthesis family protein [Mycolicibacterium vulneris]MCV7387754.1 NAD(P)-dependent oxidoreductase [Mycolicibacterium porcinum]OCB53028.1 polysaccharide biosynthesis family protein [Mycolicibacterium vulneris]OCB63923.1 polysaccharide biosynthesis family protein [Mycolicibacterium vulneris]ODR24931.1 polysaccharide biosynthesis family protein [Mycolicibacterium porcinum]